MTPSIASPLPLSFPSLPLLSHYLPCFPSFCTPLLYAFFTPAITPSFPPPLLCPFFTPFSTPIFTSFTPLRHSFTPFCSLSFPPSLTLLFKTPSQQQNTPSPINSTWVPFHSSLRAPFSAQSIPI